MKIKLKFWSCYLLGIMLIGTTFPLSCQVVWNGGIQTVSVIDQDLIINNANTISGHVSIYAQTTSIHVTISAGAQLNNLNNTSALHFRANQGQTIFVTIQDSFITTGISDAPFVITYDGGGNLIFTFEDNAQWTLNNSSGGGAYFFIAMDNFAHTPLNTSVLFTRANQASNNDVSLNFGANSGFAFIATDESQQATMQFDPTNLVNFTGRFNLAISDTASFLIQSFLTNQEAIDQTEFDNIDFTTLLGANAQVEIINDTDDGSAWSGLLVANSNNTLPILRADPMCRTLSDSPQPGFILGANGILTVGNFAYLDYVGLRLNQALFIVPSPPYNNFFNIRNASALIVDGLSTVTPEQTAQIQLNSLSGMYFRSGINNQGEIENFMGIPYAINPANKTTGIGNYTFVAEGLLNINGLNFIQDNTVNGIEILSLVTQPFGATVLIETPQFPFFSINPPEFYIFPERTYAKNMEGNYIIYNSASFLINNRVNLTNIFLKHTDENHIVFDPSTPTNQQNSEPTYMGGNRIINCDTPILSPVRPTLNFYNSALLNHTSAAFTGLDLWVASPQTTPVSTGVNIFYWYFYSNGFVLDNSIGRSAVFGTNLPVPVSFFIERIADDPNLHSANIIVQQDLPADNAQQLLFLDTFINNTFVTQNIPSNINNQFSIQSIFLGNESSIEIGTNGSQATSRDGLMTFSLIAESDFFISTPIFGGSIGALFSFVVQNDFINRIFVDNLGIFGVVGGDITTINSPRLNLSTTIVKNIFGKVILPERSVFFHTNEGVTFRELDLNDPDQTILVSFNGLTDIPFEIQRYTLNWQTVTKAYNSGYIPYELPASPPLGQIPPVVCDNLIGLPTIAGDLSQLQVIGSLIGDRVNIKVASTGILRELTFLPGFNPSEAAVANVVLDTDGVFGIGDALRDANSLDANEQMGLNNIVIIANGDGIVRLNSDILMQTVSILRGPGFGSLPNERSTLTITSEVPRELRIKSNQVLDLSQFGAAQVRFDCNGQPFMAKTDTIVIAGNVRVIMEPGSQILLGGGTLQFKGNAQLIAEPFVSSNLVDTGNVESLTGILAKLVGTGTLLFSENSQFMIPRDAYVSIENNFGVGGPLLTDITLSFSDSAGCYIGDEVSFGGSLQIGNTFDSSPAQVRFTLELSGPDAVFQIGKQGFFGVGVGVSYKQWTDAQGNLTSVDSWDLGVLYNLERVTFNIFQGSIKHNIIAPTSDTNASLFAIGPLGATATRQEEKKYFVDLAYISGRGSCSVPPGATQIECLCSIRQEAANAPMFVTNDLSGLLMQGGGNFIAVTDPTITSFHPFVEDKVGENQPGIISGICCSLPSFLNGIKQPNVVDVLEHGADVTAFAAFLAVPDNAMGGLPMANIGPMIGASNITNNQTAMLCSVSNGEITRGSAESVGSSAGSGAANVSPALQIGAVAMGVNGSVQSLNG